MQITADYDKFFPVTLVLETPRVRMRLLKEEDFEELNKIAKSAEIWKYFTKDLADEMELRQWIGEALEERAQSRRMPFLITDKDENRVCGCTSFGNISFFDKRIEIGWTWLGENFMGTGVNRQAKFAMLSYAFEAMKMERVEIKTDNLNERSKAALKKIGGREEGILRSHMQMHNNRRRDTVYFGFLKNEWEKVKYNFFVDLV